MEKKNHTDSVGYNFEKDTLERAKLYEERRFKSKLRMKYLASFERRFAQYAFDLVGPDAEIIDIPCGNGRFFPIFSKASRLTVIDYSQNMLDALVQRFKILPHVIVLKADISEIPLPDNSAELCFCMRLFHHMKSNDVRFMAIRELSRVSRKYVAISFYNTKSFKFIWRKLFRRKLHGQFTSTENIIALAKKSGLIPIKVFSKWIEPQTLIIFEKVP